MRSLCTRPSLRSALARGAAAMVSTRSSARRSGGAASASAAAGGAASPAAAISWDDVHNLRDLADVDDAILPGAAGS